VKKPKATWIEPVIEAEIAYSTVTENALLREAVFKGLRDDREMTVARKPGGKGQDAFSMEKPPRR
jgi:bifunctional non-homologous end joining protein LigD